MSKITYRCVISNNKYLSYDDVYEVICIGCDENQGGQSYHNEGTWANFTFEEIPIISESLNQWTTENSYKKNLLVYQNNMLREKTIEELSNEQNVEQDL